MTLPERIKRYEKTYHYSLTARMPVMIRVDGRAFHSFTRHFNRPFDQKIMEAMVSSAIHVAQEIQGFKAAYVQSDEATFCFTDYDTLESQGWFDYDLAKMVSLSASIMSVAFNRCFPDEFPMPVFDSRAFTVPPCDIVNAFLWRAMDWKRNSLQMYARSFFSHKQLHQKNKAHIQDMLHAIGKNWVTDLTDVEKNGTFIIREDGILNVRCDIQPSFEAINQAIRHLFVYPQ